MLVFKISQCFVGTGCTLVTASSVTAGTSAEDPGFTVAVAMGIDNESDQVS
jgi:hypothetical protein